MFKIITVLSACIALSTNTAWAKNETHPPVVPTLYLKAIKAKVQTEKNGDEVYLAITEFRHGGKNRHYTVPQFPLYWPSDALAQISALKIWKTALGPGESTEVVVSFIEHDMPPWNTDDMIGGIKIKMVNDKGSLKTHWMPISNETKEQTLAIKGDAVHRYELTGEGGDYQVDFELKK